MTQPGAPSPPGPPGPGALQRHEEQDLEESHKAGYLRIPSQPHEFDVPEEDRAWGEDAWSDELCVVVKFTGTDSLNRTSEIDVG